MPGDADLLSKVEAAAAAVAATVTFSATQTFATGLEDAELALPNVICSAFDTGEQVPKGSGNHIVRLRVTKNSNVHDTTLVDHRADVAVLFDKFRERDIGELMSAQIVGLTVYDPPADMRETANPVENKLSNTLELDLLACAADV